MRILQRAGRLAAGLAVAAAASAALTATADAQITITVPPDYCKTGAPHATWILGEPVPDSVSAESSTNAYFYSPLHGCRMFMVDVRVPTDKSVTFSAHYAGAAKLPPAQCEAYRQYERLYRRSALLLTDFSWVASRTFRGVWVQTPLAGFCFLLETASSGSFYASTANALGQTIFRVAVSAKADDWTPVRVTASYP